MGWTYMAICILDMAIFPILWNLMQVFTDNPVTQWNPLTLQGAGLFHLAMGAVLGITAWSRGQEKMAGAANLDYMQPTSHTVVSTYESPQYQSNYSRRPKYSSNRAVVGYGGKKAPPEEYQPEI